MSNSSELLTKAIYATVASIVIDVMAFQYLQGRFLRGSANIASDLGRLSVLSVASFIIYVISIVVGLACFAFRNSELTAPREKRHWYSMSLIGLCAGVGIAALCAPLPPSSSIGIFSASIDAAMALHLSSPYVVAMLFGTVLCLLTCLVTELLFRGVIFNILLREANLPSALIASSLLCYFVWPVHNHVAGLVLSSVSAFLLYRTNTILPSVFANIGFTFAAPTLSSVAHQIGKVH